MKEYPDSDEKLLNEITGPSAMIMFGTVQHSSVTEFPANFHGPSAKYLTSENTFQISKI